MANPEVKVGPTPFIPEAQNVVRSPTLVGPEAAKVRQDLGTLDERPVGVKKTVGPVGGLRPAVESSVAIPVAPATEVKPAPVTVR